MNPPFIVVHELQIDKDKFDKFLEMVFFSINIEKNKVANFAKIVLALKVYILCSSGSATTKKLGGTEPRF